MGHTFISLCTGVGMIDHAFELAGLRCVQQVEIDRACRDVLGHHWPQTPRSEDVGAFHAHRGQATVVVGGTPCQDLSIAGPNRRGLDGDRSILFYEFSRIVGECEPEVFVWENVPGALTSNKGRDFAAVLGTMDELGYSLGWRVLDGQYFGVPQRRRRLILVGSRGGVSPAEVLALGEGVPRNPGEGRAPRPPAPGSSALSHYRKSRRAMNKLDHETWVEDSITNTLNTFDNAGDVRAVELLVNEAGIRRLTPRECERLMGLPDDWTRHGASGKEIPDSRRYHMCGNGAVVPLFTWIGSRIVKELDRA